MNVIDTNAAFGVWPFQLFSSGSLEELDAKFERLGVEEVWLSAVESIGCPEPDAWDAKRFDELVGFSRFRPVKTLNPLLANWRQSLHGFAERYRLAAIKLFPGYHGYQPDDVRVVEICREAAALSLPVLIAVRINDERNQPVAMQVEGACVEAIARLSRACPETVLVALCPYNSELTALAKGSDHLLAEISFLDSAGVLEVAAEVMTAERLAFGSHEAFLHADSAVLKLAYCQLSKAEIEGIAGRNVMQRLGRPVGATV